MRGRNLGLLRAEYRYPPGPASMVPVNVIYSCKNRLWSRNLGSSWLVLYLTSAVLKDIPVALGNWR
ncbi:hypothetical protein FOXYSP1_13478 [Fusarium oxysporum f. sp. phaseoli]